MTNKDLVVLTDAAVINGPKHRNSDLIMAVLTGKALTRTIPMLQQTARQNGTAVLVFAGQTAKRPSHSWVETHGRDVSFCVDGSHVEHTVPTCLIDSTHTTAGVEVTAAVADILAGCAARANGELELCFDNGTLTVNGRDHATLLVELTQRRSGV